MRKLFITPILALLMLQPLNASAQLTPWTDFEPGEEIYNVTMVKVNPNMILDYMEGLTKTWVVANEIAKELGHIKDYAIYQSELPQSGDFNLMLVVEFASTEDLAPSKARYEEFMKKMGESRSDEIADFAQKNYPSMREITGEYNLRKINLK